MAALVQTLPPQSFAMHSGRPSSSGGYSSAQGSQNQRIRYGNQSGPGYRGMPTSGPVAPYAFTSTPQLGSPGSNFTPRPFNTGYSGRSASTSVLPQVQQNPDNTQARASGPRPPILPSFSSPVNSTLQLDFSKSPSFDLTVPASISLTSLNTTNTAKPSPDRYRRNVRRVDSTGGESGPNRVPQGSALPSGSGMAAVGQLYNHPTQASSSPSLTSYQSYRGSTYSSTQPGKSTADDMMVGRSQNAELAARYRRRSLGSLEIAGLNHTGDAQDAASPHSNSVLLPDNHHAAQKVTQRPASHGHTGSKESVSSKSARSSRPTSARTEDHAQTVSTGQSYVQPVTKPDTRVTNVPPRNADSIRRHPSPLSNPVNLNGGNNGNVAQNKTQSQPQHHAAASPAAEHLAALSQKNNKKSKSKLRRAFSFGSAAELRKATAQANLEKSAAAHASAKRGSKYQDEMEPEQARIAEKQEAGGLGESIYSGQGQFFTGSTDNLSISSTASSASIMLRKMGKGVKKGTRSLVGLFRPKSVVGVPAADGPVNQGSAAQVSMVTVEAEREKVNVNIDPHDHPGGGTGFPKLERNSIDMKTSMDSGTVSSDTRSRRSIVGGERERAEILAAVKKGILKRTDSNQSSPQLKTTETRGPDFSLPHIPHMNDSPRSSAPSTPADEPPRSGHRRTDSITIEGNDHDDYFSSMTRFASLDSKNVVPMTPQAVIRNISFSPRIQFHDTWPSGEYDRRGEIATCNRLTPMLAQQIKEELNTFKMEMEVHESSKVYTHFF